MLCLFEISPLQPLGIHLHKVIEILVKSLRAEMFRNPFSMFLQVSKVKSYLYFKSVNFLTRQRLMALGRLDLQLEVPSKERCAAINKLSCLVTDRRSQQLRSNLQPLGSKSSILSVRPLHLSSTQREGKYYNKSACATGEQASNNVYKNSCGIGNNIKPSNVRLQLSKAQGGKFFLRTI